MKLWSGMLTGKLDDIAEIFNKSINVDKRMVFEDIEASIAHVEMLGNCNILNNGEVIKIVDGLKILSKDIQEGSLKIDTNYEDIHTFIEVKLVERIGVVGKKMHTARSRNDQVVTDFRLTLRKEYREITSLLVEYIEEITNLAQSNLDTIMAGLTHLQPAQPVTFGHHILTYAFMGLRDLERMKDFLKRLNQSPLGAGALATTTHPIDRIYTAKKLGFDSIMQNSIDAVSDRDFVIEFHSNLSLIAIHLSRLCEEIILWTSQPFSYINLSDEYSTGSSIMPQKKNPDMAELIKGKSGKIIGNLNQSLIMVKGLALAYSKDFQEDKQSLFESIDIIKLSIKIITGMLKTLKINKENIEKQAKKGFINATDLADYLVEKGVAFRDAHHICAKIVGKCIKENIGLEDLKLEDYKKESEFFEEDLYTKIDLLTCVRNRKVLGGPNPEEVNRQIDFVKRAINDELNNRGE
ncbi:argininosuccinate lyase [Helcococcus bovis]|uniref:argininosuccinate lyase n=1 Tax=Helcococcus bovis TaxID=3153252 RepID=UPI0038BD25BD